MNRIFIGIVAVLAMSLPALAKKITHVTETSIAPTEADSLEALLNPGDTLLLKAKNGLSTLGGGIQFEKDRLTVILDCDSDRDGVGYISDSFKMKSMGDSTQVRLLFGKTHKSSYSNTYAFEAFPFLASNFFNPLNTSVQITLGAEGRIEQLYLVNSRADMDLLRGVIKSGNAKIIIAAWFAGDYHKGYALGGDIDMGAAEFSAMGDRDVEYFSGIFDGMGHSISNLKIQSSTEGFQGLFSSTKYAMLRNFRVLNAEIQGLKYVGAVVGWADSSSVLSGISVTGSVKGGRAVGGIAGGMTEGIVRECGNQASISTDEGDAGGVIGVVTDTNSILEGLQNHGIVTMTGTGIQGVGSIGGVVGESSSAIAKSANYGSVTSTEGNTGGIAGTMASSLGMSYNFGNVDGLNGNVGGLIGLYSGLNTLNDNVNFGSISGSKVVGGIAGVTMGGVVLYNINYGAIECSGHNYGGSSCSAGGLIGSGSSLAVKNSLNHGPVLATTGDASGASNGNHNKGNDFFVNLGSITAAYQASGFSISNPELQHALNTGAILSTGNHSFFSRATGLTEACTFPLLVSSTIVGVKATAVCGSGNVYNSDLAPLVGNQNSAAALTHNTIRNFANYPDQAVFEANWVAPTLYSIPTPKNLFASGKVFKKLRQDVMVLATAAPDTMEHPSTYLPTDGAEWKYSCISRNSRVNCAVGATDMIISQAYNVTGDEVLVLQATHSTGFVVKDSLLLKLNVARKSEPVVGANWPATLVVEEGKALDLDLSQYFSDADGETMNYSVSATQVVVSEYANGHVTLLYNKLAGEETMTIQATDEGGRLSPVASVKLVVSTLPKVVTPLSDYVLDKGKIEVVDLSTRFFDADGDVLTFTLTGAVNTESSVSGGNLTLVMNSDLGDVLVVSATDDDGHVVRDTLVLASTASPVLALPSHSALAVSVAGSHLQVRSPMAGPATLEIWGSLGDLRWSTPLTLLQGLNETTLPPLQQGQYLVRLRTDAGECTLVWQNR